MPVLPNSLPGRGARRCLCRVHGACSARAFNLTAPSPPRMDYVNVTLSHAASVAAPESPTAGIHYHGQVAPVTDRPSASRRDSHVCHEPLPV
jgi:hypothetical protein